MRSKIEVLEVLRDNLTPDKLVTGLCRLVGTLRNKNVISQTELYFLDDVIHKYIKKELDNNDPRCVRSITVIYFWESGLLQPRLDYVNYIIEQLKLEENDNSSNI